MKENKKKKERKDHFTYYFADGTKCRLTDKDVGRKWIDILNAFEKMENNNYRRETRRSDSYEMLEEQCVEKGEPDDYFVKEAFRNMDDEKLQTAVSELPSSQQEVLKLRFYEDKTIPEIAEILGASEKAIYKRYERIIKKLKNFFGIVEN